MNALFLEHLASTNQSIRDAGTFKHERVIDTAQGTLVRIADGRELLNMCANNYLGLAQHPSVRQAANDALARWGYGWLPFVLFVERKPFIKISSNA